LNEPADHSPAEPPRPRLSNRSMPTPCSASPLQIREAAGLSLPRVRPCEYTPQPRTGPSGTSTMPARASPVLPMKVIFSGRDTLVSLLLRLPGRGQTGEVINDDGATHQQW